MTTDAMFPSPMAHGPLDGVKVLDLSEDIAGSFCARLLADYGADVLKLEPPVGAALRRMPPFFGRRPAPGEEPVLPGDEPEQEVRHHQPQDGGGA